MKKLGYDGLWHIYQMECWDEDYFNMEVQAYIKINKNGTGEFHFGLVSGDIDGEISESRERLEFTWEGNDECDPVSGSGWFKRIDNDNLEGEFKIHLGDSSKFQSRRAKNTR